MVSARALHGHQLNDCLIAKAAEAIDPPEVVLRVPKNTIEAGTEAIQAPEGAPA